MPKLTSVEPQKSSKGRSAYGRKRPRFNIFLDGEFAFGADEDLVVEKRLVVGKEISVDDLEKLLFEAEVGKLMERMYRLFNIRQRSEREVRNYFRVKSKEETSELAIELVIKKLKQKNLLNDEEFAKSWVEARSKKKGKIAIKLELLQKGIDRQIINEVISEVTGEQQIAEKLLSKKINSWKNLSQLEFKKKAIDYLLRKGFEYELVKDIVEKYQKKG